MSDHDLSGFSKFCGYANAWDEGIVDNASFRGLSFTPCFAVIFVDIAHAVLFLATIFCFIIFRIRDSYFKMHDPADAMEAVLDMSCCRKFFLGIVAFLSLILAALPWYLLATGEREESYLDSNSNVVKFVIQQRFVDASIRSAAWLSVFVLWTTSLISKRPMHAFRSLVLGFLLVAVTTVFWGISYLRRDDDDASPKFYDSWIFENANYQLIAMLAVPILAILSIFATKRWEKMAPVEERYTIGSENGWSIFPQQQELFIPRWSEIRTSLGLTDFTSGFLRKSEAQPQVSVELNDRDTAANENSEEIQGHEWVATHQDSKIPSALLNTLPEKDSAEFQTLRYTAVTAGAPQDFWLNGYQLRVAQMRRPVEVLVCVTSYNEDAGEFERSLLGINRNIRHLVNVEGPDAWQKVAVVILADGRSKVNSETLDHLKVVGAYDNTVMERTCAKIPADFLKSFYLRRKMLEEADNVDGIVEAKRKEGKLAQFFQDLYATEKSKKETNENEMLSQEAIMFQRLSDPNASPLTYASVHLFERSIQMVEDINQEAFYHPMQLLLAIKERNGGKLDSHNWFFNAFAEHLQAKFTVLLDVGTIPRDRALYKLYKTLRSDPCVGGCCGEISVHKPELLKPVIASQHFEYKISNLMDKSTESVLGFITVLPGAFSAYRYEAIRGKPLEQYFLSITDGDSLGAFKGNMYLAEDRILCFELVARRECNWTLKYVKNAVAETDVPSTLLDLIKQRRRWLNGSYFALAFAVFNWQRIFATSHSFFRKGCLLLQLLYYGLTLILTWFLPSVFYISWYILLRDALGYSSSLSGVALLAFGDLFAFMLFAQFIVAIANKPNRQADFYTFSQFYFGVIGLFTIALLIQQIVTTTDVFIRAAAAATTGFLFVCAALHGELFSIMTTFVQYTFMVPMYLLAMQIFAICNTHDLSWGTKGLDSAHGHIASADHNTAQALRDADKIRAEQEKQRIAAQAKEGHLKSFRFYSSMALLACNTLLIVGVFTAESAQDNFFLVLFGVLLASTAYRFVGSVTFVLQIWARKWLNMVHHKLVPWLADLPSPEQPKHVHEGYAPLAFYNPSYADKSLTTQKFVRKPMEIEMIPALDRKTINAESAAHLQPEFLPLLDPSTFGEGFGKFKKPTRRGSGLENATVHASNERITFRF